MIFHRFLYVYQRVTVGAHLVPTNHISFNFNLFQAQCDPSLAAAKPELVMVSCLTAYMHGARSTRAFVQLAMDLKGLRHPPPSFEEPLKCTCSKWCNKPKGNLQHHSNNVQDFECCFSTKSQQHPKYIFQNHNLSNLKNRPFVSSQTPICQSAGLNRAQLIP